LWQARFTTDLASFTENVSQQGTPASGQQPAPRDLEERGTPTRSPEPRRPPLGNITNAAHSSNGTSAGDKAKKRARKEEKRRLRQAAQAAADEEKYENSVERPKNNFRLEPFLGGLEEDNNADAPPLPECARLDHLEYLDFQASRLDLFELFASLTPCALSLPFQAAVRASVNAHDNAHDFTIWQGIPEGTKGSIKEHVSYTSFSFRWFPCSYCSTTQVFRAIPKLKFYKNTWPVNIQAGNYLSGRKRDRKRKRPNRERPQSRVGINNPPSGRTRHQSQQPESSE